MATTPTASQQTVLAVYQLLNGRAPRYDVFSYQTSYIDNGAAYAAVLLTRDLRGLTDMELATAMVRNAGISNTGVVDYLVAVLASFGVGARGQVLTSWVNKLPTLENDVHFGADAVRLNRQIAANFVFSNDPGNLMSDSTASHFGTGSGVLSTAQDAFTGTQGDDTFWAVVGPPGTSPAKPTTLNPRDFIQGQDGNDILLVELAASYGGGAEIRGVQTLRISSSVAGEVAFDFNATPYFPELVNVRTLVFDRIAAGQTVTVNHVVRHLEVYGQMADLPLPVMALVGGSSPAQWGTATFNYRSEAVDTLYDQQNITLDAIHDGVVNLGPGIEYMVLTGQGSQRSTLAYSAYRDSIGPHGAPADIVSAGSLHTVGVLALAEVGKRAGIQAGTGLTDRLAGTDGGLDGQPTSLGGSTASNLLSVDSRVTRVFADSRDPSVPFSPSGGGPLNLRFVARTDGLGTNVEFAGQGSSGSYVEFALGSVSAQGGAANDTFAFIESAGSAANATFGSGDTLAGGAGADTLQLGLNGLGRFDLAASAFANVVGIETLDLRGAVNTVALPAALVARADAGAVFTVHTDRIVQTSLVDAANAPGASFAEDNAVTMLDLTGLGKGQALVLVGGSGADRVAVNDATATATLRLHGGDNRADNGGAVAGAGDYDTLTLRGGGVLDRADLSNVQGFEALLLARASVDAAGSVFGIELTGAFVRANTAAADLPGTRIDDTVFHIGVATGEGAVPVGAGDTVFLEISDLLGADRATLSTAMAGHGIDVQVGAAQVRYLVDGVAANAAQVALVTKADADAGMATRADAMPWVQGVELVGLPVGDALTG